MISLTHTAYSDGAGRHGNSRCAVSYQASNRRFRLAVARALPSSDRLLDPLGNRFIFGNDDNPRRADGKAAATIQFQVDPDFRVSRDRHILVDNRAVDSRAAADFTGADLSAMGLKPGPQYKQILSRLMDARLNGEVTSDAEERAMAARLVKGPRTS